MYAARAENTPSQHIDERLLALHDRKPQRYSEAEIAALVKDGNFHIQVAPSGVHIYNREGLHRTADIYDLFPALKVNEDAPHAFYLDVELARAEIAWQLVEQNR